jgi:hypothetical protein
MNLRSVEFVAYNLPENELLYFGHKCGDRLRKLYFRRAKRNIYNQQSFIKLCPNLLSIGGVNTNDLIETNEEQNKTITLTPKLQEFINIMDFENTDSIKHFLIYRRIPLIALK